MKINSKITTSLLLVTAAGLYAALSGEKVPEEEITEKRQTQEKTEVRRIEKPLRDIIPSQSQSFQSKPRKKRPNLVPPPAEDPTNPYIGLDKRDSFKNAIQNITPGEIRTEQSKKRNLYFERLSEQLKQLQGQQEKLKPKAPSSTDEVVTTGANDIVRSDRTIERELREAMQLQQEMRLPGEETQEETFVQEELTEEQLIDSEIDRLIDEAGL